MQRLTKVKVGIHVLMVLSAICFVAYLGYWFIIPGLVLTILIYYSALPWVMKYRQRVPLQVMFYMGFLCGAITFGLVLLSIWGEQIVRWWMS